MVEAKSRADLRKLARVLREHLKLDDVLYFPIVELLDALTEIFVEPFFPVARCSFLKKSSCRHGR